MAGLTLIAVCFPTPARAQELGGTYAAFDPFFNDWREFIRIDQHAGVYRVSALRDQQWSPPLNLRPMIEKERRMFLPDLLDQTKLSPDARTRIADTLDAASLGVQAFMTTDGNAALFSISKNWKSGDLELKAGVYLLTGTALIELRKN